MEEFLKELEEKLKEKNIENWEEILDKYEKRFNFGLESGLSDEEIIRMLGSVDDIIDSYSKKEDRDIDGLKIHVSTVADDVFFERSKDDTFHVYLENINEDSYKIIKNEKRLGFAASLNIGIEESKGKYIARMDDDDISLPERFAKQVDFMEKHPEIGISGTAAQTFGKYNNKIDVLTDPEELKTISLIRTPFIHPTVIMRKDLLDKYDLRYSTEFFSEDYELWSRAIDKFPISNIDEVLLMYRSGNGNATDGSNEAKIHNSHKKTMYNEFKNYLQLDLNNNELEVLQDRINSISGCYNEKELIQFRNNVVDKIIARNNKVKYYDPAILSKTLKKENVVNVQSNKQSLLKRGVKKWHRFMLWE